MPDFTINWIDLALLAAPLALHSELQYRKLPGLSQVLPVTSLPSLSIVVAARNEEVNLGQLLPSLTALSYPGEWELIVVDDNSSDGTTAIARGFGARVVRLDDLPAGWSGKAHACHQGAQAASGEWLLFTDADTIHHPCGPALAVAHATKNELDGLSLFFQQTTSGVLDGLLLSVAFAGLFVSLKPNGGILNGQYILLRRDVYENSGGFSAVSGESMEDLALGHRLRSMEYQVPLCRDEHIASVQMYSDRTSLWQGMSRLGAGTLRWIGAGSLVTSFFITGIMAPILALISSIRVHQHRKWALASWLAVSCSFVPWTRRFGSAWLASLAPFGALIVQLAAVWGLVRRLFGRGIRWKGRQV